MDARGSSGMLVFGGRRSNRRCSAVARALERCMSHALSLSVAALRPRFLQGAVLGPRHLRVGCALVGGSDRAVRAGLTESPCVRVCTAASNGNAPDVRHMTERVSFEKVLPGPVLSVARGVFTAPCRSCRRSPLTFHRILICLPP